MLGQCAVGETAATALSIDFYSVLGQVRNHAPPVGCHVFVVLSRRAISAAVSGKVLLEGVLYL